MDQHIAAIAGSPAMAADALHKPLLVCFSHLRWNFVYQRPQHLMTRAARQYELLFVEEPTAEPLAESRLDLQRVADGVTVAVPLVPTCLTASEVVQAQRRLLDGLLAQHRGRQRVFWYYTPMALPFTRHLQADVCVYDNMDELSAFKGACPEMLALEDELFRRCDLVFCGGQSLYEAKRHRHRSVHAFASSIDREHFTAARARPPEPADQALLGRPRLGFFGVIDERMDLPLLDRAAQLRPDWQWLMIGPVVKIDPATLPRRANVQWLGARAYDALPAYLAHWDIGIMPFALNESTRFISPTKTPEFLAAGLPVLSTAIRDVVRPYGEHGLVEIASGVDEWLAKAEALLERPRQRWLAGVDSFLAGMSWDRTWQAMQRLIAGQLPRASVIAGAAPRVSAPVRGAVAAAIGAATGVASIERAGHV